MRKSLFDPILGIAMDRNHNNIQLCMANKKLKLVEASIVATIDLLLLLSPACPVAQLWVLTSILGLIFCGPLSAAEWCMVGLDEPMN